MSLRRCRTEHGFTQEPYKFLSNMYPCSIFVDGIEFPSAENAYQACKTKDRDIRIKISKMLPKESKKFGKNIPLDKERWDDIRLDVMYLILKQKFSPQINPHLHNLLLETGSTELIEFNQWKDRFWGVYDGKGENNLGKILMKIRSEYMFSDF